jgi:thiol-disulfide isomerase/thioredoxin
VDIAGSTGFARGFWPTAGHPDGRRATGCARAQNRGVPGLRSSRRRDAAPWRAPFVATAIGVLCALVALPVPAQPASPLPGAWMPAAADADIERAFARAAAERKPVLLYWGATWCPPCNRLKATLFNRQDFIEQSRGLVMVHVDGDRPGAQRLGARFKVRGYPTLVLLQPDGTEIARLPGEAEPEQVVALLQRGLAGGRPTQAVLADAQAGRPLTPGDWHVIAYFRWESEGRPLVPEAEQPALAASLAARAPDAALADRLWLQALAASDDGKGIAADAALRARVVRVLADPAAARRQADLLVLYPVRIVRALSDEGSAEREALASRYDAALQRLAADATLSRVDRLSALGARVELARVALPPEHAGALDKLPPALLAELREQVARADREITDGYERQAVITSAAWTLGRAGLGTESDALLKANLERSHSPYYLMSQLAGNARRRGDTAEALRWSELAWQKSQGPATRLQWGASYLDALVELAPGDAARIETVFRQLVGEAVQDAGGFHDRSARSLQRAGRKLQEWNGDGRHRPTMTRLQAQLDRDCAKVSADGGAQATCRALLRPATGGGRTAGASEG